MTPENTAPPTCPTCEPVAFDIPLANGETGSAVAHAPGCPMNTEPTEPELTAEQIEAILGHDAAAPFVEILNRRNHTAPHALAPEDESYLSSLSVIADTFHGACDYCDTRNTELIPLANGRTGAAVVHHPDCRLAEATEPPYDEPLIEALVHQEQGQAH